MKAGNPVTIVVPNYNGIEFVDACLRSVLDSDENPDIIVVDNGSTDGSRERVEECYPQVKLIALKKNYGFSRAVNEGIRAAVTPYVILLNNDTELCVGFTSELVKAMEADPGIFSASAKMIQLHRKDLIDDAGDFYCAFGWAFARGKDKPVSCYNRQDEIFASCAGAAIYRKSVFEQIGYFDEAHFAYLEDIDIGYRAQIAGFRNVFVPSALVYHVGSGTSGSRHNAFKVSLTSCNSVYLIYKNMPFLQVVLNLPFLIPGFAIKFLFFLRKGLGKEYVSGLAKGLQMCRPAAKVKFCWKNIPNYVKIQVALWKNIGKKFG